MLHLPPMPPNWGGGLQMGLPTPRDFGHPTRDLKLGLEALLPQAQNLHIRIVSDNMTTVAYINAMGGCKATACDTLAKEIWSWAVMRNIWLSAAHIPGKQNILTDSLSRKFNPDVEWELNSHTFDDIAVHFGMPDIDLFANRLNHKVPLYVSWKADLHASYVDAFALDWAQFTNGYAFPPFCLISRCLQKIVLEQATLIMLVPMWYTSLVHPPSKPTDRPPESDQGHQGHSSQSTLRRRPPPEPQTTINGMQSIRKEFANQGISSDITEVLMSSWRESTQKQYNVYLSKWYQFCVQREINSMQPIVNDVLEFLHDLYKKGLSYSTINTARSALSNYLMGVSI